MSTLSTALPSVDGAIVPASELAELCAQDTELFGRTFFPQTFRQKTPEFHREILRDLDNPRYQFQAEEVFRGGGKTTLLRVFTAKRISFGVSRTILFVSETIDQSIESLKWLKERLHFNKLWVDFFGLERGKRWSETVIEVKSRPLGHTTTVIAKGITGQTRGVNIDDYRPDLIVVDDPCDFDNTASPEQRKKTSQLFFGALAPSLAPRSECPEATMVLLQTALHAEDLISSCHLDPEWRTHKFPILGPDGRSTWEERFPTSELLSKKQAYIDRNQASIWYREYECQLVGDEERYFRLEWLKELDYVPEGLIVVGGIDPVPPPSERQLAEGLVGKDYEVLFIAGLFGDRFILLDYSMKRGHDPDWTASEFFRLSAQWRPLKWRVEAVNYQRTLKWYLEQEMQRKLQYWPIEAEDTKRKKSHRIRQAFSQIASQGRLYVRPGLEDFKNQFRDYPNVPHDDVLDAASLCIEELNRQSGAMSVDVTVNQLQHLYAQQGRLEDWRSAP